MALSEMRERAETALMATHAALGVIFEKAAFADQEIADAARMALKQLEVSFANLKASTR